MASRIDQLVGSIVANSATVTSNTVDALTSTVLQDGKVTDRERQTLAAVLDRYSSKFEPAAKRKLSQFLGLVAESGSTPARSSEVKLVLLINKRELDVGERAEVSIINKTRVATSFKEIVVKDPRTGEVVFGPKKMSKAAGKVPADKTCSVTWDQKDNSGKQVAPGLYSLYIRGVKGEPGVEYMQPIMIKHTNKDLLLRTSAASYKVGQTVKLEVTGNRAVNDAGFDSCQIVDAEGGLVAVLPGSGATLAKGEKRTVTWDQKGMNGQPVRPGTYAFRLGVGFGGNAYTSSFAITK